MDSDTILRSTTFFNKPDVSAELCHGIVTAVLADLADASVGYDICLDCRRGEHH